MTIFVRRVFFVVLYLAISSQYAVSQPLDLTPPFTPQQGCEPARSEIISYRSLALTLEGELSKNTNYTSLNGEWRVKFYDAKPSISDITERTDLQNWGESAHLPQAWQVSGQGTATYSKRAYPFLESKPTPMSFPLPQSGTVALYQREFTVPFDLADKKLYINIGGSSSKVTLFINGLEAGFSTDSRGNAEYEISEYISRGLNRITLLIEEFSGASWLEDSNGWRLSGITGDIYLYAQPKIRVRDVMVNTSLDPTYKNGLLSSALLLKSELLNEHSVTVYYDLYDASGTIIRKGDKEVTLDMRREDTVRFNTTIMDVEKWSAEAPHLYTIVFSVKREGRFTEYTSYRVGFRSVEATNGTLKINGQKAHLKGVNYDEFNPTLGNTITKEQVLRDLKAMRLIGINAIRVGEYPMPAYFYEATDSLGFYVVAGANLNTSGLENNLRQGYSLANDPRWRQIFTQRVVAAYEATKRYTSVIALTMGESAGNGYNMYEAYLEVKRRNPERLIMYDGAGAEWNTDIVCPLYPRVAELEKMQTLQPVLPSRVNFDKRYWELDNTAGAFISRWSGLNLESAKASYAQKEDNYTLRKLSDGTLNLPSAQDDLENIKELFANVTMKVVNRKEGIVEITNHLKSTNLNYYTIRYRTTNGFFGKLLNKNAQWSKYTTIAVDCPSGESVQVTLKKLSDKTQCQLEIGDIFEATF